jgi:hypothetical protein
MNRISIKGVIAGIVIAQLIGGIFAIILVAVSNMMPIHLNPNDIMAYTKPSNAFKFLAFIIGLLGVFIGGYVAALVAKRDELLNAIFVSILSLGTSTYSYFTGVIPLWLLLVSVVSCLLFSGLGGYMRLRQVASKSLTHPSSGTR